MAAGASWLIVFLICSKGRAFLCLDGVPAVMDSSCFVTKGGEGKSFFSFFFKPNNDTVVISNRGILFSSGSHTTRGETRQENGKFAAAFHQLALNFSIKRTFLKPECARAARPQLGRKRGGCKGCRAEIWQCLPRARYQAQQNKHGRP